MRKRRNSTNKKTADGGSLLTRQVRRTDSTTSNRATLFFISSSFVFPLFDYLSRVLDLTKTKNSFAIVGAVHNNKEEEEEKGSEGKGQTWKMETVVQPSSRVAQREIRDN